MCFVQTGAIPIITAYTNKLTHTQTLTHAREQWTSGYLMRYDDDDVDDEI